MCTILLLASLSSFRTQMQKREILRRCWKNSSVSIEQNGKVKTHRRCLLLLLFVLLLSFFFLENGNFRVWSEIEYCWQVCFPLLSNNTTWVSRYPRKQRFREAEITGTHESRNSALFHIYFYFLLSRFHKNKLISRVRSAHKTPQEKAFYPTSYIFQLPPSLCPNLTHQVWPPIIN